MLFFKVYCEYNSNIIECVKNKKSKFLLINFTFDMSMLILLFYDKTK